MSEIALGFIIGIGIMASRIIWCHFDSKRTEKYQAEKIRKGIR